MRVRALRKITFHTSKGVVVVMPGQIFKPADPIKLLDASVVAVLPLVSRPLWQRPDGRCFACGSREAWRSIYKMTCARCHPPATPDIVKEFMRGTA